MLIGEIDDRLVPRSKERLGHNLRNIEVVLGHLPATSIMGTVDFTAYDQFCGYLILDALVANRDRHEENWAVLRDLGGQVTLAPSYDHGNSLGFNLEDRRRTLQLAQDPGLATWAGRGLADRFEDGRNVTLVDFACHSRWATQPPVPPSCGWDGCIKSQVTSGGPSSAAYLKYQRSVVRSAYSCS